MRLLLIEANRVVPVEQIVELDEGILEKLIAAGITTVEALAETLQLAKNTRTPLAMIGGGTNLIVDDEGFPGVVVRYVPHAIEIDGTRVRVEAGAMLLRDAYGALVAGAVPGRSDLCGGGRDLRDEV